MSTSGDERTTSTYQVAVSGTLCNAVRQSLPRVRSVDVSASTLFRLEIPDGLGPVEIALYLKERGLEVLSIRRTSDRAG